MSIDAWRELWVRNAPTDNEKRRLVDCQEETSLFAFLFLYDNQPSNMAQESVKNFLLLARPFLKEIMVIVVPVSSEVDLKILFDERSKALQNLRVVATDNHTQNLYSHYDVTEATLIITNSAGVLIDPHGIATIKSSPFRAMATWVELEKKQNPEKLGRKPFNQNRVPFRNTTQPRGGYAIGNQRTSYNKNTVFEDKFLKAQKHADGGVVTDDDESVFAESIASLDVSVASDAASDSDVPESRAGFGAGVSTSQETLVDAAEEKHEILEEAPKIELSEGTASKNSESILSFFSQESLNQNRYQSVFDRPDEQNNFIACVPMCDSGASKVHSSKENSVGEDEQKRYDATNSRHLHSWINFARYVNLLDCGDDDVDAVTEAISIQWSRLPFDPSEKEYKELASMLIPKAVDCDDGILVCGKLIDGKLSRENVSYDRQKAMLINAFEASLAEKLTAADDEKIVSLTEKFHSLGHLPADSLLVILESAFNNIASSQAPEAFLRCLYLIESVGCRLEKNGHPRARISISKWLKTAENIIGGIPESEKIQTHLAELNEFRENEWEKMRTNFGGNNSDFVIETHFREMEVNLQFLEMHSAKLKEFALTSSSVDASTAVTFRDVLEILFTMNISDKTFMECSSCDYPAKFYYRSSNILKMAEEMDLPKIRNFIEMAIMATLCSTPCSNCVYKMFFAQQFNLGAVKANIRIPLDTWKDFAERQLTNPTTGYISVGDFCEIIRNM